MREKLENLDGHQLLKIKRALYAQSIKAVAKRICGYEDITDFTHGGIINALESDEKRKLICVPRGTFKSSIASVAFPIWLMIRNPNIRILIDSELYTNSVSYLREIKQHLQSDKFIQIFGDWKTETWNESEIMIKPRNKILKDPTIQVGGIGTTKVGRHVDVIIGDDYNSPANSETKEQRQKVIAHYQYNQSILEPNGIYAIIGTRYHEEDLIGWALKNELSLKSEDDLRMMDKRGGLYSLGS